MHATRSHPAARALLLAVALLGLVGLTGCAWHHGYHDHATARHERPGRDLAPKRAGRETCCPFYAVCVYAPPMLPPIRVELCPDCECRGPGCVPLLVNPADPNPCVRPPRPVQVRCVRLHLPQGPPEGIAFHCPDCRCLMRVVVLLTGDRPSVQLYDCDGSPCGPFPLPKR